jgi:hypothetical protein
MGSALFSASSKWAFMGDGTVGFGRGNFALTFSRASFSGAADRWDVGIGG